MARFIEKTNTKNADIVRHYEKENVYITYTEEPDNTIFVKLLFSVNPGHGNARFCFTHFCATKKDKTIFVKITDDFTGDLDKLYKFYKSLGFKKTDNKLIYKKETK